ncbi:MAG TPA: hypothetical protein VJA16_02665 [Thermoanaerobaculia bacterium]
MSWMTEAGFAKRPLVIVEDHLYHMTELLDGLGEAPDLVGQLTVVCLDRPGPDTRRTVAAWLADHPALQVVAAVEAPELPVGSSGEGAAGGGAAGRLRPLPAAAFNSASRLCQAIAAALRPGGLLLQDIQLSTLAFIPADRWWESIYLASTVRGMFAERPPACRFVSNKRGYEATFGRDLLDAGFDPRDVIDKAEIARSVVPVVRAFLERSFPMALRLAAPGRAPWERRVARLEIEREEIEREVDLLLWSGADNAVDLGGRGVAEREPPRRHLALKAVNQEAITWSALVADRLAGGPGLAVLDVGRRVAPPDAGRAELTNAAARHLHTLRSRLDDPAAIVTAGHRYRLSERLTVGCARPVGAAGPV